MCDRLLILAEVATKELISNNSRWKSLRSSLKRKKAECGKKKGYYSKMACYEESYPDYNKMQKIFNELILLI